MSSYGHDRSGWIYYVLGERAGQPAVKIGITTNLERRPRQHGGRAWAFHEGTGATETRLHYRFRAEALGNEWFQVSFPLLNHVAALGGFQPLPRRKSKDVGPRKCQVCRCYTQNRSRMCCDDARTVLGDRVHANHDECGRCGIGP